WAQKLAEYLTNEQSQTIRFEMKSQGPSNINASASDAVGKVPAIKAVQDQAEYGVLQKVGNSYWNPTSEFGVIMANGNPNQADLQELLDTMVDGITKSAAN
ncbi:MAG: maltose ABC transporter substrate-binding protein, partial [Lachnospiraceae bacterium]|nr:maltose ABC transporter substrate-binding protein [Lachnospiraceae bacterium]